MAEYAQDESLDEDTLLKRARSFWNRASAHWREWRQEASEAYDIVSGRQWDEQDVEKLSEEGRPAVVFNRTGMMINAVAGTEANNRQMVHYSPVEPGDVRDSDVLNGAAIWVRENCDAEAEESDAFFDVLVCGLGWTETRVDYNADPDGKITIERVDPLTMYPDPSATKRNLSDMRALIRVHDIDYEKACDLWPEGMDKFLASSDTSGWGVSDTDDTYVHVRVPGDQYLHGEGGSGNSYYDKKVRIIEYQWLHSVRGFQVADPTTGSLVSLDAERFNLIKEKLSDAGVEMQSGQHYVVQTNRVAMRAYIVGSTVLEVGEGPYKDGFNYRAITGNRDRNKRVWYGLVRAMVDPQKWSNKLYTQLLHIINSNAKGGIFAETGAFERPRDAERNMAKPGSIVWLASGGMAKIQPREPGTYPIGLEHLMSTAMSAMRDVTGVNLELLGMADREQSGVLEYQRRQSALTVLAPIFDALRRYRKEQGRVLLYFILTYLPPGTLVRVTTSEGEKFVPFSAPPEELIKYDITVDQTASSPNTKDQTFGVLKELMPIMVKMGIAPPPDTLEYLPLPASLVDKWKEQINAQKEQGPPPDPAMVKAQADMQAKQMELQFKELELQHDMSLEERKAKLAEWQAGVEYELERRKAEQEMLLAQMKLEGEMALKKADAVMSSMAAQEKAENERNLAATRLMSDQHIAKMKADNDMTVAKAKAYPAQDVVKPLVEVADVVRNASDTHAKTGQTVEQAVQLMAQQQQQGMQQMQQLLQKHADETMQALQKQTGTVVNIVQQMADMMTRPRKVVRDERGRVSGMVIDQE